MVKCFKKQKNKQTDRQKYKVKYRVIILEELCERYRLLYVQNTQNTQGSPLVLNRTSFTSRSDEQTFQVILPAAVSGT